jgi:hypothetical protein
MTDPRPPDGYPYRTWASEGDVFWVPPDLRAWYAKAEPSPAERDAYWQCGVAITEPLSISEVRGVGGSRTQDPATFTETRETRQLVNLSGPDGFPRWLHLARIDLALAARRAAKIRARIDASQPRCFCGRPGTIVGAPGWYGNPDHPVPTVFACGTHLGVVTHRLAQRLADQAGRELVDDGRSVDDVLDDVLDALFAVAVS